MRRKKEKNKNFSLTPVASVVFAILVSTFLITTVCLGIYAGTFNDYTRTSDLLRDLDSIDKTIIDSSYSEVKVTDENFADRMARIDSASNSFEYKGNRIAFGVFWFTLPICIVGFNKWNNMEDSEKFEEEEEKDGNE